MDWITDRIAIGNIEDAMDADGLQAAGITAVLGLNGFPHAPKNSRFRWVILTLIDGPGNSIEEVRTAVLTLRDLCRSEKVMVHCAEGLSRSAFVVACYLSEQHSTSLDAAVAKIQQGRPRVQIDAALLGMLDEHGRLSV